MKRRLLIAAGILAAVLLLLTYETFWASNTFEGDRIVIVSKGESFKQVLDSLEHAGAIRSRMFFSLAGRVLNLTTRMQVGKYRFKSGMSNKDILNDLQRGLSIIPIAVLIPEGVRAARIARILSKELSIDSVRFVTLVHDTDFIKNLGIGSSSLEGYLMPNTYDFYWQADERNIIQALVAQFKQVFEDSLKARAEKIGLTVNEVLTLASIIDGETSIDSERAVVAGVYYNRLKKHMRLQADPTIQYIIGNGPRRLVRSDLFIESPYNTYRHTGLPPGPVNNPGKSAIVAALYPAHHKYLYFVATGEGGHKFSRTFEQHKSAVKKFRKFRRQQDIEKESQQQGS